MYINILILDNGRLGDDTRPWVLKHHILGTDYFYFFRHYIIRYYICFPRYNYTLYINYILYTIYVKI